MQQFKRNVLFLFTLTKIFLTKHVECRYVKIKARFK